MRPSRIYGHMGDLDMMLFITVGLADDAEPPSEL